MELAASTLFCLEKPLEEALPDILQVGTRSIEVTDDGPHALNMQRVERLLELTASYGLRYAVHAPFSDINIAASDSFLREAMLRRLESSIKWASALEAGVLVFHPGAVTVIDHFVPGMAWRLNIESVRRLLKFAHEYGVDAMIENVPEPYPYVMKSVEDFERFHAEVGLEYKIVLDIAHANLKGENETFLRRFGDRIGHIHVSDNRGRYDEHLKIGEGGIDWKKAVADIKESGFRGWVVVESFSGVEESLRLLRRLMGTP